MHTEAQVLTYLHAAQQILQMSRLNKALFNEGLCKAFNSNLLNIMDAADWNPLQRKYFYDWPEFSGSQTYPVWIECDMSSCEEFFTVREYYKSNRLKQLFHPNRRMCIKYHDARVRLLEYIISRLEHKLRSDYGVII